MGGEAGTAEHERGGREAIPLQREAGYRQSRPREVAEDTRPERRVLGGAQALLLASAARPAQ